MTDTEAVQAFRNRVPVIHSHPFNGRHRYQYISALIKRIDSKSSKEYLTLELYRPHEVIIARPCDVCVKLP